MKPVEGREMAFTAPGLFDKKFGEVVLEPFYGIHDSRYIMYWLSMTPKEYDRYIVNARRDEERRLALDSRTVDAVNTGEQQPEADHFMESKSSGAGNFNGEPWRDATNGGFFSYKMKTDGHSDLSLRLRYWGNETGNRTFDILVDDTLIATENTSGKWGRDEFVEEEYAIPSALIDGKKTITVKFAGQKGQDCRRNLPRQTASPRKEISCIYKSLLKDCLEKSDSDRRAYGPGGQFCFCPVSDNS